MARTSIATDAFANVTNWTNTNDNNSLVNSSGGQLTGSHSNPATAYWSGAGTFTDPQYSSLKIKTFDLGGATGQLGVTVRASTGVNSARDHYELRLVDDSGTTTKTTVLARVVNDASTTLASATVTWAVDDLIELEVTTPDGSTVRLTPMKNGVAILGGPIDDTNGARLLTGKPGVLAWTGYFGDDWDGGNVTAGGGGGSIKPNIPRLTGGAREMTGGMS